MRSSIVLKTIDSLLENMNGIGYRDLMKLHRYDIEWVNRYSQNPDIKEKVGEIKKRALVQSARELFREESVHEKYVEKNHRGLISASKTVYKRINGKTAWQRILSDAEIPYTPTRRSLSLKKLFDKLQSFGDKPEDFQHKQIYQRDSYLTKRVREIFGKFGKAVILIGVDFLSLPKIRDYEHLFSREDFFILTNDGSLLEDEKAKYMFNGLVLQYYNFKEFLSYNGREIDSKEDHYYKKFRERIIFDRIALQNLQNLNRNDEFKISLKLDERINNNFHRVNFNFRGKKVLDDSLKFYHYLSALLGI